MKRVFIPNQAKQMLKNQIIDAENEILISDLKCKDFILALLKEMKKKV